jgi:MraZ protein
MSLNAVIEPESANERVFYNFVYRHGVDEKRRVQVPAKWRAAKPEVLTLVLWPGESMDDACLLALPPREWMSLFEKLQSMPFHEPRAQALRHLIGGMSDRVALDRVGRICLPEAMMQAAKIDNEAVMVGMVDRFAIWNPTRYEVAHAQAEKLMPDAFKLI